MRIIISNPIAHIFCVLQGGSGVMPENAVTPTSLAVLVPDASMRLRRYAGECDKDIARALAISMLQGGSGVMPENALTWATMTRRSGELQGGSGVMPENAAQNNGDTDSIQELQGGSGVMPENASETSTEQPVA